MPYVITEACKDTKDRACVDVCPVDCIYEGPDQLYHPPRRVHRLRGVRARVPGNGDLPRGGRAGADAAVHPDQPGRVQGRQSAGEAAKIGARC